jgi:UrcA family protein
MKTFTASCFVAVASSIFAAAASAEPQIRQHPRSATIYVADLDLADRRDARVLYERIGYAARAVCAADELSFDTKKHSHRRRCVDSAVAAAVDRANAPLVTAIHEERRERLARL